MVKPNGLLVPVSSTYYYAYTSGLSTSSSSTALLKVINLGKSHLGEGFALICIQRLSRPNFATQRCSWWNNWITRGSSISVLSY